MRGWVEGLRARLTPRRLARLGVELLLFLAVLVAAETPPFRLSPE